MCSKAHCSSITDSPAGFSDGSVVRAAASSETGTTEDEGDDGMQGGERRHSVSNPLS